MSTNKAIFTMKLEPELRDSFMAAAAAADRPASQVVRELMRDYIERQRQADEYREYLSHKVQRARAQRDAGEFATNADVEAQAAARRETLLKQAKEAGV
ncbi:CopG family ribbon-helix-helix protein [Azotobacter vinelandii]|uniref:CopG family ribbon-helix-helix protein n=1 Tax=Azotobacter vinelandii TaxID=354 RepID=UPI002664FACD|nr:antitoxin of toxin-antitoxin stability system [Azotobacter vinelandii]WKN23090.1 antitoxin of toxin-antitoxin stability system [Azotobacter vinelandii]